MAILKLSQIWIYPIKSLGGISLPVAAVMTKGLQYDRRWMLVDEDGRFMTQRVHPKMALFTLSVDGTQLKINCQEHSLIVSLAYPTPSRLHRVQIWDDFVSAVEVSPVHSAWFSERLGRACKLVYFPEENARPVDPEYAVNNEQVSLADGYPFLIVGQSAMDDLNNRLSTPVPINRFRPNFVFTGGLPYEEDTWRYLTIGSARFIAVKPCARCMLTTVNQNTGEKGDEPLRTLSTYRKRDGKIYFGQNLVADGAATVRVGDQISFQNR